MFVVPFFLRASLPSVIQWKLVPVTLFLENHGKGLYVVDNADEWLAENGFVVKRQWHEEEIVFAEIDATKTNLSDFYSYEQLTVEQKKGTEECWRTFFVLKTEDPDEKLSEKAWNQNIENPFSKAILAIQRKMNV
jgi:hypothetical protein